MASSTRRAGCATFALRGSRIALVALLWAAPLTAQAIPEPQAGQTIRLTRLHDGVQYQGKFAGVVGDTLFIMRNARHAFPLGDVRGLEVAIRERRHHLFGGLVGAGLGALVGLVLLESSRGPDTGPC